MFQTKLVSSNLIKQYSLKTLLNPGLTGLLILGTLAIAPPNNQAFAQDTTNDETVAQAPTPENLAALVIQEINRARTNPQAYADWLESQRQYYDGMVLRFPGEKPLRTNRGLKALDEAIAFIRRQPQLPAISSASALVATAQSQVSAIVNNQSITYQDKYFVYGKVTPEGIVMQLIVDDGFPDRRHRRAIFTDDYRQAGIVCSEIAIYDQVCAIAYENTPEPVVATNANETSEVIVAAQPTETVLPDTPNTTSAVNQEEPTVETAPSVEVSTIETAEDSEIVIAAPTQEPAEEQSIADSETPEVVLDNSEPETEVSVLPEASPTNQAIETIETGTLQEGDEVIPNDGSFYDSYPIEGTAGDSFTISLESEDFDTFLAVMDKNGNIIEQNDDINEQNSNSRLEITLPSDGNYTVIVNTYDQGGTGDYVLKLRR